jgi:hypothetical protein
MYSATGDNFEWTMLVYSNVFQDKREVKVHCEDLLKEELGFVSLKIHVC